MPVQRVTILRGASGLNTREDPARLRHDPDTGVGELAVAVNVDITNTGRVSRRKGFSATAITDDVHSLFCDGGHCLFVSGTTLYRLSEDYVATEIETGLQSEAKVSYVRVNSDIFWANGYQKGRYSEDDGSNHDWVGNAYVGPDENPRHIDTDVPIGQVLAYAFGRIFIAQDNTLWFTEPLAYSWYAPGENYVMFPSYIRTVRAVDDGIYVGTSGGFYFLSGTMPKEFSLRKIGPFPVIEGTDVEVDPSMIGSGEALGSAILVMSERGILMGLNSGQVFFLTQRKLDIPDADDGSAVITPSGKYLALLNP